MDKNKQKNIQDVIEIYRELAQLQARYIGSAPTYEWTGLALNPLLEELDDVNCPFNIFYSDIKGQLLYGKRCVNFVTFGEIKNVINYQI